MTARAMLAEAGLQGLARSFALLPTGVASALGGMAGATVGPRLFPAADRRIRALVRRLRPDLSDQPAADAATRRLWNALGRVHAEFANEHRLWREGRVEIDRPDILDAIRASGRPVIAAGLHTGNWELLPITLAYAGHNIVQVFQPQPGQAAESVVRGARLRAARAIAATRGVAASDLFRLVPPARDAGLRLVAAIREGWTAVLFVDEDPGGRCVSPAFVGAPPRDGNLARVARLARLADALVLPAYVERRPDARFVVRLLPPLNIRVETDLAARLNACLAEPALRLLDQWFMLPSYRLSD